MNADRREKRRWKPSHWQTVAIVLVVVAAVVTVGVYASIRGYESSVTTKPTNKDFSRQIPAPFNGSPENDLAILAVIQSVSPETHTALVRLYVAEVFANKQSYVDSDGYLKQSLTLSIAGAVSGADGAPVSSLPYALAKGTQPTIDVTMDLPDGDAPKYPFDTYGGDLTATVRDSSGRRVPSFVGGFIAADGWTLSKTPFSGHNSFGVSLNIRRAPSSKLYALFIMGLMWALALAGVVMALILMRSRNHDVGPDHLVYLAALLFALPLMRTLLPGNPSVGVLADFAAYFWVEVVVGLTLLALLIVWISRNRPTREHDQHHKPEESTENANPAATTFG